MKTKKLIGIAIGVGITLGCSMGFMNLGNNQKQLSKIENTPEVYDAGSVGVCKLTYIRTSHVDLHSLPEKNYQEDVFFKSDCQGSVEISQVKEKINLTRMILLDETDLSVKKLKI